MGTLGFEGAKFAATVAPLSIEDAVIHHVSTSFAPAITSTTARSTFSMRGVA